MLVAGLERNQDVVMSWNRGGVGAVLFVGTTPLLGLRSEMVERNVCSCVPGLA
jgi:hypothetical protein